MIPPRIPLLPPSHVRPITLLFSWSRSLLIEGRIKIKKKKKTFDLFSSNQSSILVLPTIKIRESHMVYKSPTASLIILETTYYYIQSTQPVTIPSFQTLLQTTTARAPPFRRPPAPFGPIHIPTPDFEPSSPPSPVPHEPKRLQELSSSKSVERPWKCPQCICRYSRRDSLISHIQRRHLMMKMPTNNSSKEHGYPGWNISFMAWHGFFWQAMNPISCGRFIDPPDNRPAPNAT